MVRAPRMLPCQPASSSQPDDRALQDMLQLQRRFELAKQRIQGAPCSLVPPPLPAQGSKGSACSHAIAARRAAQPPAPAAPPCPGCCASSRAHPHFLTQPAQRLPVWLTDTLRQIASFTESKTGSAGAATGRNIRGSGQCVILVAWAAFKRGNGRVPGPQGEAWPQHRGAGLSSQPADQYMRPL